MEFEPGRGKILVVSSTDVLVAAAFIEVFLKNTVHIKDFDGLKNGIDKVILPMGTPIDAALILQDNGQVCITSPDTLMTVEHFKQASKNHYAAHGKVSNDITRPLVENGEIIGEQEVSTDERGDDTPEPIGRVINTPNTIILLAEQPVRSGDTRFFNINLS